MKQGISIQERLKDLRTERHLKLEELAELTNISKSALGSYENDEYKEISHKAIIKLADFYGVSTDYLLCQTENRNHPGIELSELHLNDDMLELLTSRRINNRLLCEIVTHEDFMQLMTDAEIYVDGIATMRFKDINGMLETVRAEVQQRYQPEGEDTALKALEASQIQEEDYFCQVTHKEWDAILHDIRQTHVGDIESAPNESNSLYMIKEAEKAMRFPGSPLDRFCFVICSHLQMRYERLSEKERTDLKNIMKKSGIYKNSPMSNRKRK